MSGLEQDQHLAANTSTKYWRGLYGSKQYSTSVKESTPGNPNKEAKSPDKVTLPKQAAVQSATAKSPDPKPAVTDDSKPAVTEPRTTQGDIDAAILENLEQMRQKNFEKMTNPDELKHFRASRKPPPRPKKFTDPAMADQSGEPVIGTDALPHPIWSEEEVHGIQITHKKPQGIIDSAAYYSVKALRSGFDLVSGYNRKPRDETLWLIRVCYLETVAGCPGMVAAMTRHLLSLRRMRRDHGWIHTLLEEAENERMHLMTALQLKQPSWLFRMSVMATQGVFVPLWFVAYMISPKYCHRFVGYLEEEAVVTYTKLLGDIENGEMQHWKTQPAPFVAKRYWHLAPDATMKDVILAMRADEAHHRVVNHTLGSMKPHDYNPYKPGQ